MIAYARSTMPPGQIGGVPARATFELDEIPPEMLGDRPPVTRYELYERDFNALVAIQVGAGRVDRDTAEGAMINFHDALVEQERGQNV